MTNALTARALSPKTVDRFWKKVDTSAGLFECWPWPACRDEDGYGLVYVERRPVLAHRFALASWGTPVPPDKRVLHSCDNPPCVNPAHLRVGTPADNVADMWARGRARPTGPLGKRLTHCKRGHEFTPENTRVARNGDHRCRTCQRNWDRTRARANHLTPTQEAAG